jgi:hypothetical protein
VKRARSALIIPLLIAGGGLVFSAAYASTDQYLNDQRDQTSAKACNGAHATYNITIRDSALLPEHTDAKRCDTLIVTNTDNQVRLIAFGVHERHVAYNGITERLLKQNQSLTVTLDQPGTYTLHDHNQENVEGSFTVNE